MKTLIRNGKIILEDEIIESDLLIDDDKILGFQNSDDAKVIDASGLVVAPGLVDLLMFILMDVRVLILWMPPKNHLKS